MNVEMLEQNFEKGERKLKASRKAFMKMRSKLRQAEQTVKDREKAVFEASKHLRKERNTAADDIEEDGSGGLWAGGDT